MNVRSLGLGLLHVLCVSAIVACSTGSDGGTEPDSGLLGETDAGSGDTGNVDAGHTDGGNADAGADSGPGVDCGNAAACTTDGECSTGSATQCLAGKCTNGCCTVTKAAPGAGCSDSGGSYCDGDGHCVECNSSTDCTSTGTACKQSACVSNKCQTTSAAKDIDCSADGTGGKVCDAAGTCVQCNVATQCAPQTTTCKTNRCTSGACGTANAAKGTACSDSGGVVCDGNGTCVATHCNDGAKDADETDVDCGGSCGACADTKHCSVGNDCQSKVCDPGGHTCTAASCGDGSRNGDETDVDCGGAICDALSKTCAVGGGCKSASDCETGYCRGGDSTCQPRPGGTTCSDNAQCASGVCGLGGTGNCCSSACATGACGATGCDANGACIYPDATNVCGAASCSDGQLTGPGSCNGTGGCSGGILAACPGGLKCASATACLAICMTDADCQSPSDYCSAGGTCVPKATAGAACSGNNQCASAACGVSGGGTHCCTAACPSTVAACGATDCDANGACVYPDANTRPASLQTPGDCAATTCDGAGGSTSVIDDTDLPGDNGNQCSTRACAGGVPTATPSPLGTGCSTNGNVCDGAGTCLRTFMVVRVGDGASALSSSATAAFVEEYKLDGSPFGNVSLPTAVNGANFRLTVSGSATSEGFISRSTDGRFVVMAGYDAAPGTTSVVGASAASVGRVIARVDRSYAVDTSTKFTTAFSATNVRSACTTNGTDLWATGGSGGIHYTSLGGVGTSTQLTMAVGNQRVCHAFFGQLYTSSGSSNFANVLGVGTGTPTTSGQTVTVLPGLPTTGASVYSYVFLDTTDDGAPDLLYVADDRTGASGGGIYKWRLVNGSWTAGTPAVTNLGGSGARGLAGYFEDGKVTLIASTTATTANTIVVATDDLSGNPLTQSTVLTASVNKVFRGVALGVQ